MTSLVSFRDLHREPFLDANLAGQSSPRLPSGRLSGRQLGRPELPKTSQILPYTATSPDKSEDGLVGYARSV